MGIRFPKYRTCEESHNDPSCCLKCVSFFKVLLGCERNTGQISLTVGTKSQLFNRVRKNSKIFIKLKFTRSNFD